MGLLLLPQKLDTGGREHSHEKCGSGSYMSYIMAERLTDSEDVSHR